jgi:hypothetical protein
MGLALLAPHGFKIDIGAVVLAESRLEAGGRLATRLGGLVGFQRALDDFSHRALLAPRQPMRQIARPGAARGELGLGHGAFLVR